MIQGFVTDLRPLRADDDARIISWRSDPAVARFLSRATITSESHAAWCARSQANGDRNFIIQTKSGAPIGQISLYHIDTVHRHAEWGRYCIGDPAHRGGPCAAEAEFQLLDFAFRELGLVKVYCQTLATNQQVISQHSSFGFSIDGVLRRHFLAEDGYVGMVHQSILAEEFAAVRARHERLFSRLGAKR